MLTSRLARSFLSVAVILLLTSCVAPARSDKMIVVAPPAPTGFRERVSVTGVTRSGGGPGTNLSLVGERDLRSALEQSLDLAGYRTANPENATFRLTAQLLTLENSQASLWRLTFTSGIRYVLTQRDTSAAVLDEIVFARCEVDTARGTERPAVVLQQGVECAIGKNIAGFLAKVRALASAPLLADVGPKDTLYSSPEHRWSIVYPSDWRFDSIRGPGGDWTRIQAPANAGICGVHVNQLRPMTLEEAVDRLLAGYTQVFKARGMTAVVVERRLILSPSGTTGYDIIVELRPGGKSRQTYFLVGDRLMHVDCETYARDWDRLDAIFDRILRSFTPPM
jgi:hypothetical protein